MCVLVAAQSFLDLHVCLDQSLLNFYTCPVTISSLATFVPLKFTLKVGR